VTPITRDYSGLVGYAKDRRVDAYIDALPRWQQQVCHRLRDLVHAADPAVEETIKRRAQPYVVCEGNVCALLTARDHVNVFLYDGGIVPDPEAIITAGHDNKTARTVSVRERETINEPALTAMFRHSPAGLSRLVRRESERGHVRGLSAWATSVTRLRRPNGVDCSGSARGRAVPR
jgi:hypothetical protein